MKLRIRQLEDQINSERLSYSRRIGDIENQNRNHLLEINRLRNENANLQFQVRAKPQEVAAPPPIPINHTRENELKAEIESLRKTINEKNSEISIEKLDNDSLRSKIKRLETDLVEVHNKPYQSNRSLNHLDHDNNRVKYVKHTLDADLGIGDSSDIQSKLNKSRLDMEELRNKIQQENRKGTEFKKSLEEAESIQKDHVRQIENLKSEIQDLKWKLDKSEKSIESLQKEIKEYQQERGKFIENEARSKGVFAENEAKLKADFLETQAKLKAAATESELRLKIQVEYMTKEISNKEEKLNKLTQSYSSLSAKYTELTDSSSRHSHSMSRDDDTVHFLKDENENLRKMNSKLMMELNELRGENTNLRSARNSYMPPNREFQELSAKMMLLENKMTTDRDQGIL